MSCRSLLFVIVVSGCVAPLDVDQTESRLTSEATTIVSLTFDDTFSDNFQVGDIVEARGMRATFYVNSGRLATSGYMTTQQLLSLQARGHEIAGHTISHARLTEVSQNEARIQVCNDRAALLDAGFSVTSFAYPFAANNATVEQIVRDCGYNSARDVGGLVEPGACSGCPFANPIPPANLFAIRTHDSVNTGTTLAELQRRVTAAEQNGGGYVPFVFHHVCNGCNPEAVSPATLAAFLDWLEDRAPTTQVGTVHEVIGGTVKPAVRISPPQTTGLQNPSLEIDANGDQVPDCWQRGGYGTNSATYALVSDAVAGNVAQRITITSFSSGGRRLVSAQDSGTCAPSAAPGQTFTMTAWYKATTPTRFSVYYRDAGGSWVWFAQSPLFPTSSTYRQVSYTSPPLPAGATAISMGLGIFDVGTLTMDAYTLVNNSTPPPQDTTPPTLAVTCNGTTCSSNPYAAPVTVALSATDTGSGVREVRYTTNGSDPTNGTLYSGPFTVSASASVRATAVDNANNRTNRTVPITIEDDEPPAPGTNMLQNASLEIDANGNQVPDCWQRGGYGTNTATYTLVSDAFAGNVAQRLDITSFSSGGRRLNSQQDAGACAPAVTPGRSYTMTGYYKSNVQPRFSVYIRSTSGAWRWFAESAPLPASVSYRQAIYTSPPLPADATHISIGLSIFSVGSITTDAYTLVDAAGAPPPPPPPPGTNMLANASLENDADGNGIPDCWQRGGYGTNTATWALVGDAFAGSVAQRLEITSFDSGGRRLNSLQDSGTCAPAVLAGRRYTMTGRYKANVQPRFSVYIRSTSGAWRWFAESAPLPPSSSYTEASYTSPPLPSDATHISVGLSIFGIGTITSDSYTLVEAP